MLRPQDTTTRRDQATRRHLELHGRRLRGRPRQRWWRGALPDVRRMPVPSSFNDILVDPKLHDHVGDVWYQRDVFIPAAGTNSASCCASTRRPTAPRCGSMTPLSLEHEGGYTPFEADVTPFVTPGEECRLTVVVNNEFSWQSIPPGVVEFLPTGRGVSASTTTSSTTRVSTAASGCPRRLAPASTTSRWPSDIDEGTGVVRYEVEVADAGAATVRVRLRDAGGVVVASAEGANGALRVPRPELWGPGRGYLYDLEVELVDDNDVVDRYPLPSASAPCGSRAPASSSTVSPSTSRASGCTRTCPSTAAVTTMPQWSTTSRCSPGSGPIVPYVALPLCRGGPGACRPRGHRRDR